MPAAARRRRPAHRRPLRCGSSFRRVFRCRFGHRSVQMIDGHANAHEHVCLIDQSEPQTFPSPQICQHASPAIRIRCDRQFARIIADDRQRRYRCCRCIASFERSSHADHTPSPVARLRAPALQVAGERRAGGAHPGGPRATWAAAADPGPPLSAGRSDRAGRPARRQLRAQPARGREQRVPGHRLLRRPLHGRDGRHPGQPAGEAGRARRRAGAGDPARPGRRLLDGRHGRASTRSKTPGTSSAR